VRQARRDEQHVTRRQCVVGSARDLAAAPFGRNGFPITRDLTADGDFCVSALDDENIVERRVNLGFTGLVAVDEVDVGPRAI
jgi:hypothetical protein